MSREYHSKYKSWIIRYFSVSPERRASVQKVYEDMNEDGMRANLTTVYRNLDRLADDRILRKQKVPGEDGFSYQYIQPDMGCSEHLHLYCSRCGKVFHLNCDFMQKIALHLHREHGFSLNCRDAMIVGLCEDCRKAEEEKRKDEQA